MSLAAGQPAHPLRHRTAGRLAAAIAGDDRTFGVVPRLKIPHARGYRRGPGCVAKRMVCQANRNPRSPIRVMAG
jgi:hypothetical protein